MLNEGYITFGCTFSSPPYCGLWVNLPNSLSHDYYEYFLVWQDGICEVGEQLLLDPYGFGVCGCISSPPHIPWPQDGKCYPLYTQVNTKPWTQKRNSCRLLQWQRMQLQKVCEFRDLVKLTSSITHLYKSLFPHCYASIGPSNICANSFRDPVRRDTNSVSAHHFQVYYIFFME